MSSLWLRPHSSAFLCVPLCLCVFPLAPRRDLSDPTQNKSRPEERLPKKQLGLTLSGANARRERHRETRHDIHSPNELEAPNGHGSTPSGCRTIPNFHPPTRIPA
jgi:hypothetical protein